MIRFYFPILTIIVLLVSGCKKNPAETECSSAPFDRKEMVSHLTTQYIIPAYNAYSVYTKELQIKVDSFTLHPTIDGLIACRLAWRHLAVAWQNVAFLEFGPAENISLRSQTNIYPADTVQINSNISNGGYNLAAPANYSAKGIQSLDYLLHLPNTSNQEIADYYTFSTNASMYLSEVVLELKTNANTITNAWQNYSEGFINNTSDNAQGSAVSNMVNAISAHFETFVRKGKVGIPVGIFNGFSQTPMPENSEAFYSNYSNILLIAQMTALNRFINGHAFLTDDDGAGLDNYIDYVEAKKGSENLSAAIKNQISAVISNTEALTLPMPQAVISEEEKTKALYTSMQKLVPLLKVDLTSALGVLLTYQDNDGD